MNSLFADVPAPTKGLPDRLPPWLQDQYVLGLSLGQWLGLGFALVVAVLAGFLAQWLLRSVVWLVAGVRRTAWDVESMSILRGPLRLLVGLLVLSALLPLLHLNDVARQNLNKGIEVGVILGGIWLVLRFLTLGSGLLRAVLSRGLQGSAVRALQTQIVLANTILRVVVVLIGSAMILLEFDVVRGLGVSLLASAGVTGIVLGLAAQRAMTALVAGIQLAMTHPIKIGDVVVVEGETGTVEEITLTHVVVRIWDQRRLILPATYFLEKTFQNWTRVSTDLLGTVVLGTDYTISVEEVRSEARRIVEGSDLWDHKEFAVQVTDLTEQGVQLRVLVSAADSAALFSLCCLVREQLLLWLQRVKKQTGAAPKSGES